MNIPLNAPAGQLYFPLTHTLIPACPACPLMSLSGELACGELDCGELVEPAESVEGMPGLSVYLTKRSCLYYYLFHIILTARSKKIMNTDVSEMRRMIAGYLHL